MRAMQIARVETSLDVNLSFFGGTHQEEVRRLFEFPSRRFDESLR